MVEAGQKGVEKGLFLGLAGGWLLPRLPNLCCGGSMKRDPPYVQPPTSFGFQLPASIFQLYGEQTRVTVDR